MTPENVEKGTLLIAEPSLMLDIYFNRTVILVAEYNKKGTVGFILNKPLSYNIHDLFPDIKAKFKIYNGGPVEQDKLYFIHNVPDLIPNSIEIADAIYWGGTFALVKELINNNTINTKNVKFFLGYTGWDQGQLEQEISNTSWIVSRNQHQKKIIEAPASNLWQKKIIELGGDYLIWVNAPLDPNFN